MLLGTVSFRREGKEHKLVMQTDGSFTCDDEKVHETASLMMDRHKDEYSPARGAYGGEVLDHLTQLLNGKLTLSPHAYGKEGVIY